VVPERFFVGLDQVFVELTDQRVPRRLAQLRSQSPQEFRRRHEYQRVETSVVTTPVYSPGNFRREYPSFLLLRIGRRIHRMTAFTVTVERSARQVAGKLFRVQPGFRMAEIRDLLDLSPDSGLGEDSGASAFGYDYPS
jgi:hypothetical protein